MKQAVTRKADRGLTLTALVWLVSPCCAVLRACRVPWLQRKAVSSSSSSRRCHHKSSSSSSSRTASSYEGSGRATSLCQAAECEAVSFFHAASSVRVAQQAVTPLCATKTSGVVFVISWDMLVSCWGADPRVQQQVFSPWPCVTETLGDYFLSQANLSWEPRAHRAASAAVPKPF